MSLQERARDSLGAAGLDRAQGRPVSPMRAVAAAALAGGATGLAIYRFLRGGETNEEE